MKKQSTYLVPAVASAVALACGASSAASLTSTGQLRVTNEYIDYVASSAATTVTLPKLSFSTTDDTYAADSTVQLTLSGASITSASAIGTITCTNAAGTSTMMTLTYASVSGGVISLTVNRTGATMSASAATVGYCTIDTGKINVLVNSLSKNSAVTVDWNGVYASGTKFDRLTSTGAPSGIGANTIGNTFPQFLAVTTTTRDQLTPTSYIDTAASGSFAKTVNASVPTRFSTTSTNSYISSIGYDSWSMTSRDEGATGGLAAGAVPNVNAAVPVSSRSLAISGNFGFLDDAADGCSVTDLTAGAGTLATSVTGATAGTSVVASTCGSLTIPQGTVTAANVKTRLNFFVEGASDAAADNTAGPATIRTKTGLAIPTSSFTATTSFLDAASVVLGSVTHTAQAWKLSNAAVAGTVNIPYLPYGTGISRIVYATNKAAVAVVASFAGNTEAGTACSSTNFSTVTIPAGGVTLLTSAIDAGLAACGVSATASSKAQVTVTLTPATGSITTAAQGDVVITANYNVNGDRVNILNSSN